MEGNRDEAEKCVQIAREALSAGNRDKAQRFLQKAEKLYPLPAARGEPRPPRDPGPRALRPAGRGRASPRGHRRAAAGCRVTGPLPDQPRPLRSDRSWDSSGFIWLHHPWAQNVAVP